MEHVPVLASTIAEHISIPKDGVIVDVTLGHGGHSLMLGEKLGPCGILLGLDVDDKSIERAQSNLSSLACKVILVRENFARIAEVCESQGLKGKRQKTAVEPYCTLPYPTIQSIRVSSHPKAGNR